MAMATWPTPRKHNIEKIYYETSGSITKIYEIWYEKKIAAGNTVLRLENFHIT